MATSRPLEKDDPEVARWKQLIWKIERILNVPIAFWVPMECFLLNISLMSVGGYRESLIIGSIKFRWDKLTLLVYYPVYVFYSKSTIETVEKRTEICLKLTRIRKRFYWRCFGVFIANFEHISYLFLVFLLLTLNN